MNLTKKLMVFAALAFLLGHSCNQHAEKYRESITYLALGDSYTIGESVDPGSRYPFQLKDSLGAIGYLVSDLKILARTGWTTTDLLYAIDTASLRENYDLVTLLIGVNNQYREWDLSLYESEFRNLLEKAIQFANGEAKQVIVISIPDWGVTPFGIETGRETISKEIDQYNEMNRAISIEAGVGYVDITGISRLAVAEPDLLANDGLHPSELMYHSWVGKMIDDVVLILSE